MTNNITQAHTNVSEAHNIYKIYVGDVIKIKVLCRPRLVYEWWYDNDIRFIAQTHVRMFYMTMAISVTH